MVGAHVYAHMPKCGIDTRHIIKKSIPCDKASTQENAGLNMCKDGAKEQHPKWRKVQPWLTIWYCRK